MFEAAEEFSIGEIKAYRSFAFPDALADSKNDPFFSVETAPKWITSLGYQLYLEQDDTTSSISSWSSDNASTKQLRAYRNCMLSDEYLGHSFFSLEEPEAWIRPVAFQTYMEAHYGSFQEYRNMRDTPASSRAPSRADSSISVVSSRPSSRASFAPSSRASSPFSLAPSADLSRPTSTLSFRNDNFDAMREDPSRPSSTLSFNDIQRDESDGAEFPAVPLLPPPSNRLASPGGPVPDAASAMYHPPSHAIDNVPETHIKKRTKGNKKSREVSAQIQITRQLKVDRIIDVPKVPSTWTVPHTPTAYRIDTSTSKELMTTKTGHLLTLDSFIRQEDQDSWGGSAGHSAGDVKVRGITSDPDEELFCRRAHLFCNGVKTCEFLDPTLFADCERHEPDFEAMRELWNHELDANEKEAASAPSILARFYARIMSSKCKVRCDGVPVLVRKTAPSSHGKEFFVGCSQWSRHEQYQHIYWPIASNINEAALKFALDNDGLLPDGFLPGAETTVNATCVLTVHPRVQLQNCSFSHIRNNRMMPAKLVNRPCKTKMAVFVPVDPSYSHLALVVIHTPHNHPAHPATKPSAEDRIKLGRAIDAFGLTGLTVQKLLNAPSTSTVFDGQRVSTSSPAFTNTRKVRDLITEKKKDVYPRGMGFDGVLYELSTREPALPKEERYIHTAMSKNGFRIIVTMHPRIAVYIHRLLSLNIDFTFKRVEGKMDEWEIAGMLDRQKKRLTFGSLYCDGKTREAFAQLFAELFDVIYLLTGERFKLAPWYPDAKCRVIILDGEVPQAQGLADFLVTYNDPKISGIDTRDTVELIKHCVKTCNPHFERHIIEMPQHIPQSTIARMKSIMGLSTQEDINQWYEWIENETDEAIINWLAHKRANPWVIPSVNKFLSSIKNDDWDITPVHSNYAETAHAARNAETSVGVGLLTAILQARERDNIKALELLQVERDGVMSKRWNGSAEREKLSAQRQIWNARKFARRNDELTSHDSLKSERDAGTEENKVSLARQKDLDSQIKSLQEEMKIDRHRTDLKERVNGLRKEIEAEKALRREWIVRRAAIDTELSALRKGPLAGVRIKGRRPARPEEDEDANGNQAEDASMENPSNFELVDDPTAEEVQADQMASFTEFQHIDHEFMANTMPEYQMVGDAGPNGNMDTPDLDADFRTDMAAFEQTFVNPGYGDWDATMDDMFSGLDPSEIDFGVGYQVYNSTDAPPDDHVSYEDTLEYFGPPTTYSTLLGQHEGGEISTPSADPGEMDLPRLPPPPASSPPGRDDEESTVAPGGDIEAAIAPRDIDLEFDERNILSGKRRRTVSARLRTDLEEPANKKNSKAKKF